MNQPQDVFSSMSEPTEGLELQTRATARNPRVPLRERMEYTTKFGEFGFGSGQFTEPNGLAVAPCGDIIVCDTNNNRLEVFDKNGNYRFEIFLHVHQDDAHHNQFKLATKEKMLKFSDPDVPNEVREGGCFPNRVAVVPSTAEIVVTERYPNPQVKVFNMTGKFRRKFGSDKLQYPRALALDKEENIVVVECKVMRVTIFTLSGTCLQQMSLTGKLNFPNGVCISKKNEILISDNRDHCIKVFDWQGKLLRSIGEPHVTHFPIGVELGPDDEVIVADNHNNFNLTYFTIDGKLKRAFESKVKHAQCFDIALTPDNNIVLASKDYRMYIYDPARVTGQPERRRRILTQYLSEER